jgi:HEAT repeat protein
MTDVGRSDFHRLIQSFANGKVGASVLPLEDESFWREVFSESGQEDRRHHDTAIGAERLLRSPLDAGASRARHVAALDAVTAHDVTIRRHAVHCLDEESPGRDTFEVAARAVHDLDPEVGAGALRLFIKHRPPETLDILLNALARSTDLRETMAAETLPHMPGALPGLSRLLDDDDALIRWRASRCLVQMAEGGRRDTFEPLLKAFHDDSPDVARVAADGLLALGPGVSVPVLRSVLRQPLTEATTLALHSYALHAPPAEVLRPVAQASSGMSGSTRTLMAVDKALARLESST